MVKNSRAADKAADRLADILTQPSEILDSPEIFGCDLRWRTYIPCRLAVSGREC